MTGTGGRWVSLTARIVMGAIGAAAFALWLLGAYGVLLARFANAGDPHGYGLIFGMMFAIVGGLLCVATLPFALPGRYRLRALAIGLTIFLVSGALLAVAFATTTTPLPPCATAPQCTKHP